MPKTKLPTANELLDITKSEKPKAVLVAYIDEKGTFQVAACKGVPNFKAAEKLLKQAQERILGV